MTFNEGDRILAKSQRVGTVLKPLWIMPYHSLIQFDDTGQRFWILSELLQPLPPDWKLFKKQRTKKAAA